MVHCTEAAGTFSEHRHPGFVSAEVLYVSVDPLQGKVLISQGQVSRNLLRLKTEEPEAAEPASVSTIKLSATALGEQLDRPRGSCEGVDEPLPSSKPESGNFWRNMTKSL